MRKRKNGCVVAAIFTVGLMLFSGCSNPNADKHNSVADLSAPAPAPARAPTAQPIVGESKVVQPWTNSLGHVFVPVPGTKVLFSIWDTRVKDFAAYASAAKVANTSWQNPQVLGVAVTTSDDCPVVNVSWEDAKGFCQWLTEKERAAGLIKRNQSYRLPTDVEWSVAVGLKEPEAGLPHDKDEVNTNDRPWGRQWPPIAGAGNYEDESVNTKFSGWSVIEGYKDGFATTSPVGSFKANQFGLYDMGGNVWQMCEDWYDDAHQWRVARGGSWDNGTPDFLLSSHRNTCAPTYGSTDTGFRCVLATSPEP